MSDPAVPLAGPAPTQRALRIGLTGPIGCGKSTVAGWLAERGAVVVDADRVAREVSELGGPAYAGIVEAFGPAILTPDGALDRAALARRVFADPAELRRLEAIVHPTVRPRILAAFSEADAAGAPAVVVEAIKLVEGGLAAHCDEVWLVRCGPAAQRVRLAARGVAPDDAERRLAAQGDLEARLAPAATRIVDTDGDPGTARERAMAAYEAALAARG